MRRPIPSVHSKSHEDRANHPGRSGDVSALTRALAGPKENWPITPAYEAWPIAGYGEKEKWSAKPGTVLGDTSEGTPGSSIPTGERTTVDMVEGESPMDFTNYGSGASYDEATGPLDHTRRNRGIEWAPTEYEQEQNRIQKDAVLDAVSEVFKDAR
jgi:hypothetical protein